MNDLFRLDDQHRVCKATGVRRVFQHVKTEAIATYKTQCAHCGSEHLVRIPIVHHTRPPIVPDRPQSTLCAECVSRVRSVRTNTGNRPGCKLPPKGHPVQRPLPDYLNPACGEEIE